MSPVPLSWEPISGCPPGLGALMTHVVRHDPRMRKPRCNSVRTRGGARGRHETGYDSIRGGQPRSNRGLNGAALLIPGSAMAGQRAPRTARHNDMWWGATGATWPPGGWWGGYNASRVGWRDRSDGSRSGLSVLFVPRNSSSTGRGCAYLNLAFTLPHEAAAAETGTARPTSGRGSSLAPSFPTRLRPSTDSGKSRSIRGHSRSGRYRPMLRPSPTLSTPRTRQVARPGTRPPRM